MIGSQAKTEEPVGIMSVPGKKVGGSEAIGSSFKAERKQRETQHGTVIVPKGLKKHDVLDTLDHHGEELMGLSSVRVFVLAVLAGSFITFGATLSVVISSGEIESGPMKILQSLGFLSGFSLVIISGAALYTEVNVAIPVYLLVRDGKEREPLVRVFWVWFLVWFGNVCGSLITSAALVGANALSSSQEDYLFSIAELKLKEGLEYGDWHAWLRVFLSAMLGNWMVGMAAYNAAGGKSIQGQIMGIVFPILMFVSLGLQHSPANMGYLHLSLLSGIPSVTWAQVWIWNLLPASIGNLIGAGFFVALPFYYAFAKQTKPKNRVVIHRALENIV